MPSPLQEITVLLERERIRFDDTTAVYDARRVVPESAVDPDTGKPTDGLPVGLSVLGPAKPEELQPRLTYRLYGRWKTYKNKRLNIEEKQFAFQTFVKSQPHGRVGTINYLKTAPNVGQRTATLLWEKFGGDAVRVLRESPDVAVAAVNANHFTTAKAQEAAEFLENEVALEGCTIDLIDVLSGRGFPKTTARAAVQRWGNKAADVIKRCPYYLMAFRGCGFLKTDAMYLDLGLNPGRLKRQALCAWHAMASDQSGHIWYPVRWVEQALRQRIGGVNVAPFAALKLAKTVGMVATRRDDQGQLWIADGGAAAAELRVAEALALAELESIESGVEWPGPEGLTGISDHQRDRLNLALRSKIGILSGAPGTGKTFIAAAVIRRIVEEHGESSVAVAAPTGKAAVRVTENMQAQGLPLTAKTIHSLLGVESSSSEGERDTGGSSSWSFRHHVGNPLPYQFLIVDESSMIDVSLMASFLSARAKGTHVLFVGDIHQLPPVGRGAPLRDMIDAGVPTGELTEIRRNSGTIVRNCHAIKNSQPLRPSTRIDCDAEDPENLYLVQSNGPEQQILRILAGIEAAKGDGLDPVWDCQVVTAVNGRSKLSRKDLNKVLQEELNRTGERAGSNPFRVGDKIVCLKNGFLDIDGEGVTVSETDPDAETDDDGKVYVANGELAEVLHVEESLTVARLSNPTRVVRIPRGKTKDSGGGSSGGSDSGNGGNGGDGGDGGDSGCSWDLGYALSVHKSQGSEWPVVIVVLDEYPGARMICTREWIYTAISRARKLCLMVGKLGTATAMTKREALSKRKTFLVERIQEERNMNQVSSRQEMEVASVGQ